eukprot:2695269-Karenia_brevis.AAC.1
MQQSDKCAAATQPSQHVRARRWQHVAPLLNEMQQSAGTLCSTQPSQHARGGDNDSMWHSCSTRCDRGLE